VNNKIIDRTVSGCQRGGDWWYRIQRRILYKSSMGNITKKDFIDFYYETKKNYHK